MFQIIKRTSGFWHNFNSGAKEVNLSDFNIVLDNLGQTYIIQSLNGSNIPNIEVGIADIEVIDETDASIVETFATVELLKDRLEQLGYTPYLQAQGFTQDIIDALENANNPDALNPFATMADVGGGGGSQTLNQVLIEGNTTSGEDISISNGDKILLDNGANLKKGTTDAGLGGSKGIALRCAVDYELKWEAGRLYVMGGDGFTIREVSYNFTTTPTVTDDDTKGFVVDSRWILDNGDLYVCTDATTGAAVWELVANGVPTLQQVTDIGNTTSNSIQVIDANDSTILTPTNILAQFYNSAGGGQFEFVGLSYQQFIKRFWDGANYITNYFNLPELADMADGTIALTTDIPPAGVTSVGLTMPSAFSVANSPITSTGDIAVTGAGLVSQYIRGDGTLANFPTSTGGGSSISFYLNGSVSQGTIGGVAFREMDKTPILGTGTDFTINADGYIQSFITDAGVPNQLEIPSGNWNFETYFSASSGGGSPSFYMELYKWDGATLSLIASNSVSPKLITNGTAIDPYFSALAVPQTTLLATDRLAVRIYVNHSGKTITLHTEDNHLCQVITTFSTGLTALNGLTAQIQNLAVGTSGTDFAISSASATHTFNLPTASATNRGALSSTDWSNFNSKEPTITAGTTSQYYRGDKTFQTLNKSAVGLSNVDNTSDINKPVSTATQTAIDTATLLGDNANGQLSLASGNIDFDYSDLSAGDGIVTNFHVKHDSTDFVDLSSNEYSVSDIISKHSLTLKNNEFNVEVGNPTTPSLAAIIISPSLIRLSNSYFTGSSGAFRATDTGTINIGGGGASPIITLNGDVNISKDKLLIKGTSTGKTNLTTANTSATDYTVTLPATTGTVALTSQLATTMTNVAGGLVPTPPNNTTTFLRGDGTFAAPAGGGGASQVKLSSQTLTAGSWTLVGSYYEYTFSNANIVSTGFVNFTPNNASINEVSTCRMLPQIDAATGTCKFYSLFPPQTNIVGEIVIFIL